jgi:hypothetical protein
MAGQEAPIFDPAHRLADPVLVHLQSLLRPAYRRQTRFLR